MTKHTGTCSNCKKSFEVIITWTDNDKAQNVSDMQPRICPFCSSSYTMRFDVDPSKWHGVYSTNE
jgi:hypothetical protein